MRLENMQFKGLCCRVLEQGDFVSNGTAMWSTGGYRQL